MYKMELQLASQENCLRKKFWNWDKLWRQLDQVFKHTCDSFVAWVKIDLNHEDHLRLLTWNECKADYGAIMEKKYLIL